MNIIQLTPGAGAMYCGNCFRDNALVAALRQLGHDVLMVPLYLPLTLDEEDQSAGTPIFFSGINVYLEQQSALFRQAPKWFHDLFASRSLLKWAAGKAAKTKAQDLGELTLSMLQGEHGNQERELEELIAWVKTQPKPDLICLSNSLLIGMARQLKSELGVPVVCNFQGEDAFLDALPVSERDQCWKIIAEKASDVAAFIAPSRYFANHMRERLALPAERVRVVYNGINLEGYGDDGKEPTEAGNQPSSPVTRPPSLALGYFARMCPEKGLDTLVEAYINLRQKGRVKQVKLRIGGGCGPSDEPFVDALRERLKTAGLLEEVEFCPNLDHAGKLAFLKSLSIFSVPSRLGEAFGLYIIEALAAGVPVVQPRTAAFPELIEMTRGGVLFEPGDTTSLADRLEELLLDPARARALGETGRRAVFERFSARAMAQATAQVYLDAVGSRSQPATLNPQPS